MDEQDPKRREMQTPIPTHPPDPAERGDEEKVAGAKPGNPNASTLHSVGLAPGEPVDPGVGGPGLGQAPQDGNAAGVRNQQTRSDDSAGKTG